MRHCVAVVACLSGLVACAGSTKGEIHYYFMPELGGQAQGCAQFAKVAPVFGPDDFRVTLSGASVGRPPDGDPQSAKAYLDKWGLGVLNPQAGRDRGIQGQVQLNGGGGGEFLRLEFPNPVRLNSLTFASVGLADTFTLIGDGRQVELAPLFGGASTIRSVSLAQGNWPGKVDLTQASSSLGFAKVWDIVARGSGYGDGVQLENLGVVEIPEPSGLVLLLLGAAGLAGLLLGRRLRPA